MTTPPGDDASPDASPASPPRSDSREGWTSSRPATGADGTAAPKPPQAWFTPPQMPAPPDPPPPETHTPSKSPAEYIDVALIGAATLLLLSVFLPWTTWSTPDFGRDVLGGITASRGHVAYGLTGANGQIVVMAGMAALALAIAGRAVDRRFLPYAAIPGGLSLVAVFHQGVTLGDAGLTESISWGFWITVLAAVAVLGLGLVALAREHPAQS